MLAARIIKGSGMKKTAKTQDDLRTEFEEYFKGLRNTVLKYDDYLAPAGAFVVSDSLDELLAQCDETADFSAEDQAWLDSKPVGRELF